MVARRRHEPARGGIPLANSGEQRIARLRAVADETIRPSEVPAFLRVPPFPGSRPATFVRTSEARAALSAAEIDALIQSVRAHRVGGTYWGSQPPLPQGGYILVRLRDAAERARRLAALPDERFVVWLDDSADTSADGPETTTVTGVCDPWHLLARARAVIVDADDELALIAAIAGVPIECVDTGRFELLGTEFRDAFRQHVLDAFAFSDPYSGEPIGIAEAIEHCAFWRRLIDSNRDLDGAVGFAFWKRETVAPLLWRGADGVPFRSNADGVRKGERIAIWKSRTAPAVLSRLEHAGAELIEVEDGFIRSVGLGADCVPPLSIIVDRLGVHFDPERPSEFEELLQNGDFSTDLLERARVLRELIVASGVSKYGAGHAPLERRAPDRRHILVPGQVEDDRAVVSGGAGLTSNLELLRCVRAEAPDAFLIYKPHPDVEAGHRRGAIDDDACLSVADEIVRDEPISALLELADEVHVNSSLAGFEALLRQKPVTTHGVPFYAGWGLTRDLGPVQARRTAKRSLDELVAAVLLLYPRYLDPVTGLPCPAEILVRRLAGSTAINRDGIIVRLRRLQGRCRRGLATVRNWRGIS